MAFRRELTRVALAAVLLLALLPASAVAAPQWVGGDALDRAGTGVGAPDVTTDADGNSAAVWVTPGGAVRAALRPFGGPWGEPETLEAEDPAGPITNSAPRIVVRPNGDLVAVWLADAGGVSGDYVRWSRRPRSGDWSATA